MFTATANNGKRTKLPSNFQRVAGMFRRTASTMRKLNAEQKKMLKEWFENNKSSCTFMFTVDQLPSDIYYQIASLNEFETLNAVIEDYVHELVSADIDKEEKRLTKNAENGKNLPKRT
jgi:hypothetical protein